MYFLYSHPKYSKFKQKYQEMRPVFPNYLSVSYDYGGRNLDEYFRFYSVTDQKFKIMKYF